MPYSSRFRVRPFSRSARTDYKDVFRVYLSRPALVSLKLEPGDPCCLLLDDGLDKHSPATRPAIAWNAAETSIKDNVVQISKSLQELYGFKLEDRVSVRRVEEGIADAVFVVVREVGIEEAGALNDTDKPHWEWYLQWMLERAEIVGSGLRLAVELKGEDRYFIVDIAGQGLHPATRLWRVTGGTKVTIGRGDMVSTKSRRVCQTQPSKSIGGLERQVAQIDRLLRRLAPGRSLPTFYKPFQGLLIYGPKGTGKTLIVEQLARSNWETVLRLTPDSNKMDWTRIPQTGSALIIVEQLEQIAPRRGIPDLHSTVSRVLNIFDAVRGREVLVVAETRHPNEIDETVRAPERFGVELEIPIPNAKNRVQILRAIRGDYFVPTDETLDYVAMRTHGYVGADLLSLVNTAVDIALDREESGAGIDHLHDLRDSRISLETIKETSPVDKWKGNENPITIPASADGIDVAQHSALSILMSDFNQALVMIRPTVMQEVFLETPNVRWSSIGGLQETKRQLQNAVERPLKKPELMAQLGQQPTKGVLLYGPPGCSKTMLVKALATETSLNFLAVKGAELVSMYVGESERAVRELFRKARAASPSIIFFDEIDAIASDRKGKGGAGELNVLTTLLNEMDGFEELRNVLVVAATNKPEAIDSAMMRPGRFDKVVYVGLPDLEARKDILGLRFARSNVHADVQEFAEMTDGYSGAEMISVCQTAGDYALDEDRGFITREDLLKAVQHVPKGVSWDTLQEYERWNQARRAKVELNW